METTAKALRTTADVLRQQQQDHDAVVPLTKTTPAAVNDGLSYLAKHVSSGTVLRFSKDGKFYQPTQGDAELMEGTELVCHWDQAQAGFQRFSGEIFVFQTMSVTGLRAVANLLRQSSRVAAKDSDHLPVIKLRAGGFDHRKFGWVRVPAFEFVGRAPKTNIAAAATSISADLDDAIPF